MSPARPQAHGLADTLLRAWRRSLPIEDWQLLSPMARDYADGQISFARQRKRGQILIRVTSPPLRAKDQSSAGSIIELISDDMPFLVDTMTLALTEAGYGVRLIVHPILAATRTKTGRLRELAAASDSTRDRSESWQYWWIERVADPGECRRLEERLRGALKQVRLAATDWEAMRAKIRALFVELETDPPPLPADIVRESRELLLYMEQHHFTLIGYREHALKFTSRGPELIPIKGTDLGILRLSGREGRRPRTRVPAENIRRHLKSEDLLVLSKANLRSTVHRGGYMDYVGVKRFDHQGRWIGEARIIGLWTSSAYRADPRTVPLVRLKVQRVIDHFPFRPTSHDGKRLVQIIESLPRDELFQASYQDLVKIVRDILALQDRQQPRLVMRRDEFRRYWSCLIYVPRDRFNSEVRHQIEALVQRTLDGKHMDSSLTLSDSALVQLHLLVRTDPGAVESIDRGKLEREIAAELITWRDRLRDALLSEHDEQRTAALERHYADAVPAAYRQEVPPALAVSDIDDLEALDQAPGAVHLRLHRPEGQAPERLHLRIIRRGEPLSISEVLPILENFGLRVISEHPYALTWPGRLSAWIQDFELEQHERRRLDVAALAPELTWAFNAVRAGELDNDEFNRLLISAGLSVRQANVLRACCRYLLQAAIPFSQSTMARTLNHHAGIARELWQLFECRLNPQLPAARAARQAGAIEKRIRDAVAAVRSPDEDRILRAYLALILATLRTNYYRDSTALTGECLAFKFDPQQIPRLPEPRPAFEIFVYSPRVEGVHMRRGPIARGGIRWSERAEDFRTEILGLMKAQHVKNTLIVPVGAKGGFVARRLRPGTSPDERAATVKSCYQSFIRGLLSVTDNIVANRVVGPPQVRRRDADDPYLVVAADKGTAAFSDVANGIAAEFNFWLGDAFASGGSAGYDHKKMGITARGAWECVKRHFRELGRDIQRQPFTVAGIGDMSGDVFGNGMLLSKQIRLVAAFNHAHIFIDPEPDAARSFKERERLFRLPRSGWNDYAAAVISAGGGVFDRSEKTLTLSTEVRALLGLDQAHASPEEVIRAVLRLPVDLLWVGGIGTYVKSTEERDGEIGDRANDALRVNGAELRAKVVGEGGNLGFSQRGRIEYAQRGGRLNTDFVDNSAGVNTSDEEVNLKILLASHSKNTPLVGKRRQTLLAAVTDEVAAHVLRNNYLQSQALSLLQRRASAELADQLQLLRTLQGTADLDRALEFLPTDAQIEERLARGEGLTRPELAVLLAYGKIGLNHALAQANIAADPYLAQELQRYFPERFRVRFADAINHHRLRSQLINTATTNSILHRMDPGFVLRLGAQTGADTAAIARAYTVARDSAGLRALWVGIESLDNRIATEQQYDALLTTRDFVDHLTRRLLAGGAASYAEIGVAVGRLGPAFRELSTVLPAALHGLERDRYSALNANYLKMGMPVALAGHLAALPALRCTPDILQLSGSGDVHSTASLYFSAGAQLGADWLHQAIEQLRSVGPWQAIARERLYAASAEAHRRICAAILKNAGRQRGAAAVTKWLGRGGASMAQWQQTLRDLRSTAAPDLAALMAGVEALRRLA
jgi:glutamate dehydrogenase